PAPWLGANHPARTSSTGSASPVPEDRSERHTVQPESLRRGTARPSGQPEEDEADAIGIDATAKAAAETNAWRALYAQELQGRRGPGVPKGQRARLVPLAVASHGGHYDPGQVRARSGKGNPGAYPCGDLADLRRARFGEGPAGDGGDRVILSSEPIS